jgi:hypothetical protein
MARRLVSQRTYARGRGISHEAVRKRTIEHGGPLPTYGPAKQIDPDEADALYVATMPANGAANSRFQGPDGASVASAAQAAAAASGPASASQLVRARTAMVLTEAQLRRLQLDQRRGELVSRSRAQLKAFHFARTLRDSLQAWPTRAGPQLAALFEIDDVAAFTVALEDAVRTLLDDLANERVDF